MTENSIDAKIRNIIQDILIESFTSGEKTSIKETNSSLQFACPYCGDSVKSEAKKRGHFYKDSSYFHCYNCNTHKSFFNFIMDFNKVDRFSYDELDMIEEELRVKAQTFNYIRNEINIDILFDIKQVNGLAISRSALKETLSLVEVKNTLAEKYLVSRGQYNLSHYLYDKQKNQIWILNRVKNQKIISAQIRNLNDRGPKYYTHTLSSLYTLMNLTPTDEVHKIKDISLVFNIFNVDFTREIKVLEGPFDAYLLDNAIARLGVNKKLPFEFGNFVYINDYDSAGLKDSMNKLNMGHKVFLWKKFLEENKQLQLNAYDKIDITDIVVAARKQGIPIPPLSKYYAADKYDLYFL